MTETSGFQPELADAMAHEPAPAPEPEPVAAPEPEPVAAPDVPEGQPAWLREVIASFHDRLTRLGG